MLVGHSACKGHRNQGGEACVQTMLKYSVAAAQIQLLSPERGDMSFRLRDIEMFLRGNKQTKEARPQPCTLHHFEIIIAACKQRLKLQEGGST